MTNKAKNILKQVVDDAPQSPGVYHFIDKFGKAVYVGKAVSLKNRLENYLHLERLSPRMQNAVLQIDKVKFTHCRSEKEALLTEAEHIRSLQPRYNILLKDNKSFPSIFINSDHEFPSIKVHRGKQVDRGQYFGPFATGGHAYHIVDTLRKAFMIRSCKDSDFANRKRPCLEYQIKRCNAPCVGFVLAEDYANQINAAMDVLRGKNEDIVAQMESKMNFLSQNMEYEKAAKMRDRIMALSGMALNNGIKLKGSFDVWAIHNPDRQQSCIYILFVRDGNNCGGISVFPENAQGEDDGAIISAAMMQFYHRHNPASTIVASVPVANITEISQAILTKDGAEIDFLYNKRQYKDIVDFALYNAKKGLELHLGQKMQSIKHFEYMQKMLNMPSIPNRIEIFDNSHIMGSSSVGAMVVASLQGMVKSEYRKFNFTEQKSSGDDYGMMAEMLSKRIKSIAEKKHSNQMDAIPDLWIIDGGVGQASIAKEVMNNSPIKIRFFCVSKGPNRNAGNEVFILDTGETLRLPKDHPTLHYIQNLRDKAHNYAITSHRSKRDKSTMVSALDLIPQIGRARKLALLKHFGSIQKIKNATIEELSCVRGIHIGLAKAIKDFFTNQPTS